MVQLENGLSSNSVNMSESGPLATMKDRSTRAVTNEDVVDFRLRKIEESKVQEIRSNVLSITDENGETRIADLGSKEDLERLATKHKTYKNQEGKRESSDPKTGVLRLEKKDIPTSFELGDQFPIKSILLDNEMKKSSGVIDSLLMLIPLIPVPVYTPNMYMLITGQPCSVVSDSFSILRIYMICKNIILGRPELRSRTHMSIRSIQKFHQMGILDEKTLRGFINNCTLRSDSKIGNLEYLMPLFNTGSITKEIFDELLASISSVNRCEKASWSTTKTCTEDILSKFTNRRIELSETACTLFDSINTATFDTPTIIRISECLNMVTTWFLQSYEEEICDLYTLAAEKPIEGFKKERYRSSMLSVMKWPNRSEIGDELLGNIDKNGRTITKIRTICLLKREYQETSSFPEIFRDFMDFLNYEPRTDKALIEDTKSVELKILEISNQMKLEMNRSQPDESAMLEN
jgi:hypothetical protein